MISANPSLLFPSLFSLPGRLSHLAAPRLATMGALTLEPTEGTGNEGDSDSINMQWKGSSRSILPVLDLKIKGIHEQF